MLINHKEPKITEIIVATDEKWKDIQEQMEFLDRLVDSQNLYIHHLEQKILDLSLELEVQNNELNEALMSGVCLDEAKVLAKNFLKGKKCGNKLVAELLSTIYNSPVSPKELK